MKLVIWGAGGCAKSYIESLEPMHEVVAIVDNNKDLHGEVRYGSLVQSPEILPRLSYEKLIIASVFDEPICQQIQSDKLASEENILSVYRNPIRCSQFTTKKHRACVCPQEFIEKMDNRRWYHAIELSPDCFTPGNVRPNPELLNYPEVLDMNGKKVLDIGAWDGGYTFLAEKRGAQVTAYDIQDPDHSGFNIAKKILKSNAKHLLGSVYDLNPQKHGMYDIVIYFGVFYHLFDPLRAFCNINRVLREGGLLLFEGAILDHAYNIDEQWADRRDMMEVYTATPLSYYTSKNYWNDWSTWFVPNMLCLKEWLYSAGFEVIADHVVEHNSRGYGIAKKVSEPLDEHEVL